MLDFHKKTLENSFSVTATLQCQAENIFNFFRHYSGLSDEAKKVMDRRISEYKKGIDDLKKAMDDGYGEAEEFYNKNSFSVFQDQTAKILKVYLDQAKCMPPDLKKTMEELAGTYKAGCDAFRKYIDKNIWSKRDGLHTIESLKLKNNQMKATSVHMIIEPHSEKI